MLYNQNQLAFQMKDKCTNDCEDEDETANIQVELVQKIFPWYKKKSMVQKKINGTKKFFHGITK